MRRFLLAIGLVLSLCAGARAQGAIVGPSNGILCNQGAQFNAVTATTTSIQAGVAGKIIVICGWHITSTQSTANTFQLEYGTQGGPCTTPTTITPPLVVTSTAPATDHIDFAMLGIPAGAQLCVVTTGSTVGTAGMIWLSQY